MPPTARPVARRAAHGVPDRTQSRPTSRGAGIAVTTQLESVLRIGGKLAPILSRTRRAKNGRYPRDARAPSGPTAQRPPWWSWGAAPMLCVCPCGVCGWREVGLAGALRPFRGGGNSSNPDPSPHNLPTALCAPPAGTVLMQGPTGAHGGTSRPTVDSQQHGLIPDSSMETSQTHISRAPYPVRATRAAAEQEGKQVAHPRAASLSAIRMYFTPAEIRVVRRRCLTTAAGVRTCRASHSVAHSHACERAQALSLADFWRRCRHTSLT